MEKEEGKSRSKRLLRYGGILLECTLGLALVGLVLVHQTKKADSVVLASSSASEKLVAVPATICLTDDRTGDNLQFNYPSGTYTFTHCSPLLSLSGTGVTRNTGVILLNDVKPDRNVSAGFLQGQGTGRAVITIKLASGVSKTITINQTIPNRPCTTCP